MGRQITIDVSELLDIYYAGIGTGGSSQYLGGFLKNDIKVTKQDIEELANKYRNDPDYGEEDAEAIIDALLWLATVETIR